MNRLRVLEPREVAGGEAGQLRTRGNATKHFHGRNFAGAEREGRARCVRCRIALLICCFSCCARSSSGCGIAIEHEGEIWLPICMLDAAASQTNRHFERYERCRRGIARTIPRVNRASAAPQPANCPICLRSKSLSTIAIGPGALLRTAIRALRSDCASFRNCWTF